MSRAGRSLDGVIEGVVRCRALADDPDRLAARDDRVSGWTVGQHVEHLRLAAHGILNWIERDLEDAAASPTSGGPSPRGWVVLLSGRIPRGKATAPEKTVPDPSGAVSPEELAELEALARRLRPALDRIQGSDRTFAHPILGHFTPARWLRFLDVHHRHHERIISDIR